MKEIKDKLSKMSDLLDELERSEVNKDKEYHLIIDEEVLDVEYYTNVTREWRFFLYRRSDNTQMCYGDKKRLKSFMRLRNIKPNQVITEFDFGKW